MSQPKAPSIVVEAGPHARVNTVCSIAIPDELKLPEHPLLTAGKTKLQGQIERGPQGSALVFVLDRLPAGKSKTFKIVAGEAAEGVALKKGKGAVSVSIGGRPFTEYLHQKALARPYLAPILGPGGVEMTRKIEKRGTQGYDHPHHRSVWVSHGLVNGTDNWSEDGNHGKTVHAGFESLSSGAVTGAIIETCEWTSPAGDKILDDRRVIRFYALDAGSRCVDFTYTLATGHDAVLFGDTKEGGMLSVRVNPQINAPTGTIENSFGGINEGETWGKRAHWCDYSGVIEGVHAGIAIFDHPSNLRHPVYWHVRNYGLMTANPFGVSYFEKGSGKRGEWLLSAESDATFAYRLYIHEGDAKRGRVHDAYHDYINPPACSWAG
ncbi:MAG: hypothetical protein GF320_20320 [Armatimonadia bacterium]|nr:hypothetical protein [Armatimonadia bacterium]